MNDNAITTADGVEIYEDIMKEYADEYISSLVRREDIEKPNVFTGMIKYINRKIKFNNNKKIYSSIELLNNIWVNYTELVYKYNQKPTIEEFALLLGISRDTIYSWMNGDKRGNIYRDAAGNVIDDFFEWNNAHRGEPYTVEPSSSRADTIKKFQDECRIGRYKSAATGNVGGIFLCKAVDGMVETAPVPVANAAQVQSIEQLQERYLEGTKTAALPPPKADF